VRRLRVTAKPVQPGTLCQSCTSANRETPATTPAAATVNGGKLKTLRTARGLTLRLLADRAGVSIALLSILETGHRINTGTSNLAAVATALNVPLADLLQGPQATTPATARARPGRQAQPTEPAELLIDGPQLAELRRKRGMTQNLLADRAGISASLLQKLEENARRSASLASLSALARALNVP